METDWDEVKWNGMVHCNPFIAFPSIPTQSMNVSMEWNGIKLNGVRSKRGQLNWDEIKCAWHELQCNRMGKIEGNGIEWNGRFPYIPSHSIPSHTMPFIRISFYHRDELKLIKMQWQQTNWNEKGRNWRKGKRMEWEGMEWNAMQWDWIGWKGNEQNAMASYHCKFAIKTVLGELLAPRKTLPGKKSPKNGCTSTASRSLRFDPSPRKS